MIKELNISLSGHDEMNTHTQANAPLDMVANKRQAVWEYFSFNCTGSN